jgi:hypothetical protein
MFGSQVRQFTPIMMTPPGEHIFSVQLPRCTMWGWQRRSSAGALLACSDQLFPDYVACLCDAQRDG